MILNISHITKSFGKKNILKDINLQINNGEMVGVTGENGCGKSTLLKIVTGNLKPDSGNVYAKGKIGYCPQECILFPQLTVKENFRYFSSAYGLARSECDAQLNFLTDYFYFEKYITQKVINLSSGTKQKLNLCLALMHEPDLLILDEPYNGFDWHTFNCFWEYTGILKERNSAILIVAHLLTNVEIFDKVYELNEGVLL